MRRRSNKTRYSIKYFPFSPGIPWKIKNAKYVIPEIDYDIWTNVLTNKEIVVTCFGGVFESFFSLAYFEALVDFESNRKISWLGYSKYEPFVRAQSLATISNINLQPNQLEEYPVPLFFDSENRAYYNVLNNYRMTKSYWGSKPIENKGPLTAQIFTNSLVSWEGYSPQFRRLYDMSGDYRKWCTNSKLKDNKRFILVIPEKEGELPVGLDWEYQHVREFAALLQTMPVVVATRHPYRYYNGRVKIVDVDDFVSMLNLVSKAFVVLSADIDWLYVAMMTGSARIIAQDVVGPADLYRNADFLQVDNVISTTDRWLSPMEAFEIEKGLHD